MPEPDTSTWPLAKPLDYAEAWEVGVMHNRPQYAADELNSHQPAPFDPIFHRKEDPENHGWHIARHITNPSAIAGMRSYLTTRLYKRIHPEVDSAWAQILARREIERQVQAVVDRAMREALEHPDAYTVGAFASIVVDALLELKTTVRA